MNNYNLQELNDLVPQVRRDIVRMVHAQNSGHPGGSLGCAEYFIALYKVIMNHNTDFSMDGIHEDLFFLSNGHISPVFYSVLARSGYFPIEELKTFRMIDSRLQGHPTTHEGLPGVRVASGSLGQGLSVAVGAALTKKLNQDSSIVYTLHGDGELQEGQIWEAAMFASAHKVDNLISTIDYNGRQIDGDVDEVLSLGNLENKWIAFGWQTLNCNGNDLEEIIRTLSKAKEMTGNGQPIMIIMKTEMGHGVDYMMGSHKWHGVAPNDEQLEVALNQNPETIGDY
ncbi:MAG: transketolase [Bacteroidota bacterium]|nr:transketolase [Bacteroidota bacterium]MEC8286462.1 transketolase [Bacteroidota bacterium]MEC8513776.1 transketolase [Bacteroidota bacterium]MED6302240.1 transketolase [Bacteroidota bacterium]